VAGANVLCQFDTRCGSPLRPLVPFYRWAPLLLYVHGKFEPPLHPLDVVETEGKEKDRHPWQRPLAEYLHIIKYLTRPGEWVLDLTGGSFASGKAAKLLGRNYVGVDIDPKAVEKGREWVEGD
jgi:DNA modification methylase